eukprot:29337-Pelagococcus_subviridis.AAC.8
MGSDPGESTNTNGIERRRLDELPAHARVDVELNRARELVRANRAQDEELLKRVEVGSPRLRDVLRLGRRAVVDVLPRRGVSLEHLAERRLLLARVIRLRLGFGIRFRRGRVGRGVAVRDGDVFGRPRGLLPRERRRRAAKLRQVAQAHHLEPELLAQPLARDVLRPSLVPQTAGQQEPVLGRVQRPFVPENRRRERERKQQLVLLEQRPADVLVQRVREKVDEVIETFGQLGRLLRVLDRVREQVDVPRERVLVHRLDVTQLSDVEEEVRDVNRYGAVSQARGVDLLLRLRGDLLLPVDLVRELLRARDDVDRGLGLEDAALARAQDFDDLVFDLFQLPRVLRALKHELHLLLFEVGTLFRDRDPEELIGQTVDRDHHVQQRDLDRSLGEVVRVAELGRDVEPKVFVVLHGVVSELDAHAAPLLEDALQEERLERRVELFADIRAFV